MGLAAGGVGGVAVACLMAREALERERTREEEERELPRCLVPQGTALEAVRQVREEVEQVIECSVCMERPAATCFVSCGHLFCCDQTCGSSKTRTCPICLVPVEGKVKVFGPMQAQVLKSLFSLYIIYCILHIIYTTIHQYILSEITAY